MAGAEAEREGDGKTRGIAERGLCGRVGSV